MGPVWGGGLVWALPGNLWKFKHETVQFCAYLKQKFEIKKYMVRENIQLPTFTYKDRYFVTKVRKISSNSHLTHRGFERVLH